MMSVSWDLKFKFTTMKRRNFVKYSALGATAVMIGSSKSQAQSKVEEVNENTMSTRIGMSAYFSRCYHSRIHIAQHTENGMVHRTLTDCTAVVNKKEYLLMDGIVDTMD